MDKFIGTKLLAAAAMTRADYDAYRGWTLPADENGADEGYLVEYLDGGKPNHPAHDGYISWSPKEQFENTYQPTNRMTFGHALEMLKAGHRVARAGWNGKDMFVYMVPPNTYPVQTGAAAAHFGEGAMVPYNAYFALKGADDKVSTWVPSSTDCAAEDWTVVV
jgi:hypothetical protein